MITIFGFSNFAFNESTTSFNLVAAAARFGALTSSPSERLGQWLTKTNNCSFLPLINNSPFTIKISLVKSCFSPGNVTAIAFEDLTLKSFLLYNNATSMPRSSGES